MRSLGIIKEKNKAPSEVLCKKMMDFCKILTPFGFLTENDTIKGIFISHNSENNIMTIIHHDSVAMKEDIDEYDYYDTNLFDVLEYCEYYKIPVVGFYN